MPLGDCAHTSRRRLELGRLDLDSDSRAACSGRRLGVSGPTTVPRVAIRAVASPAWAWAGPTSMRWTLWSPWPALYLVPTRAMRPEEAFHPPLALTSASKSSPAVSISYSP